MCLVHLAAVQDPLFHGGVWGGHLTHGSVSTCLRTGGWVDDELLQNVSKMTPSQKVFNYLKLLFGQ